MPNFYERSWDRIVSQSTINEIHDRTGYSEREILQGAIEFMDQYTEGMDGGERNQAWVDFLDLMVEGGHTKEEREEFMRDELGIDPADFDWEGWRELMGYGRGK